ncbi:MAG: sensor histidine kinase [Parahaliea sp.]
MAVRTGLTARLLWLGLLPGLLIMLVLGWLLDSSIRQSLYGGLGQRLAERADRIQASLEQDANGRWHHSGGRGSDEFSQIFSGWYWLFQSGEQTLYSRSLWDAGLADRGAGAPAGLLRATDPRGMPLFGLERAVGSAGDNGFLRVYAPAREVTADLSRIRRALVLGLSALLLGNALITLVQVRVGLQPLVLLRQRLAAIQGAGTAETALGEDYGPDLDPLAREIDALLERNARMLARSRAHAANLSHALKTPLARLSVEAGRSGNLAAPLVLAQVNSINGLIERHLSRSTTAGDSALPQSVPLRELLTQMVQLMRQINRERALDWQLAAGDECHWRGDRADMEEMLGNLLDNAGKWAATRVRIRLSVQETGDVPAELVVRIADDGPGIDDANLQAAGQRGRRFDESTPGSGLGLSIVAEIAHTWGGRLGLARNAGLGGLEASLVLPVALPSKK